MKTDNKPLVCLGCLRYNKNTCELLGDVTEEKIKLCINGGYSLHRPDHWFSTRIYNNKRGAYWSTKDTEGRMS